MTISFAKSVGQPVILTHAFQMNILFGDGQYKYQSSTKITHEGHKWARMRKKEQGGLHRTQSCQRLVRRFLLAVLLSGMRLLTSIIAAMDTNGRLKRCPQVYIRVDTSG